MSDKIHDNGAADQRMSSPILRDMAEQPMLDGVPFAGARWKMADRDLQSGLIGKLLHADLPETRTHTIASAAVRCHQQRVGVRILGFPHFTPPAQDVAVTK